MYEDMLSDDVVHIGPIRAKWVYLDEDDVIATEFNRINGNHGANVVTDQAPWLSFTLLTAENVTEVYN